ncbi:hypothetical protein Q4601_00305 [Shewanella sp. 1_MG-2023]|uniref:KfrA N-terminal DNA-binding domain-containing protein n=1 Tax=Shewanella electrodiphila TaxID=934143 RepID=A0ABT0KK41_9GAMM|nr:MULTISPECIES: hypothetical protein [Shewanella]MCC4831051.1 hypothetical protein [Shewanella sp. 10N.7]MCL1044203.1 hypothetical protein [Shewanella electrodiphila]MDO6610194.1 hypothetical protein [Shewanella sp. 7_MG-2023]MDO6769664.1 hypothetical protein [Shewanella sp. 2_MG-2023]MDO6792728.1 hypothetical protein [Shewanella sp. 1_MG-2023]
MSPIEQVLAAAKTIAMNGHTPTMALIKGKLGGRVPMPILIQGLQQFKAIPKEQWQTLPDLGDALETTKQATNDAPSMIEQQLMAQMQQMKIEFEAKIESLEKRVLQLENKQ